MEGHKYPGVSRLKKEEINEFSTQISKENELKLNLAEFLTILTTKCLCRWWQY